MHFEFLEYEEILPSSWIEISQYLKANLLKIRYWMQKFSHDFCWVWSHSKQQPDFSLAVLFFTRKLALMTVVVRILCHHTYDHRNNWGHCRCHELCARELNENQHQGNIWHFSAGAVLCKILDMSFSSALQVSCQSFFSIYVLGIWFLSLLSLFMKPEKLSGLF